MLGQFRVGRWAMFLASRGFLGFLQFLQFLLPLGFLVFREFLGILWFLEFLGPLGFQWRIGSQALRRFRMCVRFVAFQCWGGVRFPRDWFKKRKRGPPKRWLPTLCGGYACLLYHFRVGRWAMFPAFPGFLGFLGILGFLGFLGFLRFLVFLVFLGFLWLLGFLVFLVLLQSLGFLRAPRLIMVTILTRLARIDSRGMPLGRIVRMRILGRLEWMG